MTDHLQELTEIIERLVKTGRSSIEDILEYTEGADIRQVNDILVAVSNKIKDDKTYEKRKSISRSKSSYLPIIFPHANPLISQWWFTLDSIEKLSERLFLINGEKPIAFLGAPTIGFYHSNCFPETKSYIFDLDENIIETLISEDITNTKVYDAYNELDDEFIGKFSSVVIDPPWYDNDIRVFLYRAFQLLDSGGYIFCMLPPRLTRPTIIEERNNLMADLIGSKFKIISLESNFVKYLMPPFEQFAFKDIDAIKTNPWRNGDVLILKKTNESTFNKPDVKAQKSFQTFTRKGSILRVFQKFVVEFANQADYFIEIPEFENNVSTRKYDANDICIWTTSKKAIKIKDNTVSNFILNKWSEGFNINETADLLFEKFPHLTDSIGIINQLDLKLGIWRDQNFTSIRKTPKEIDTLSKNLSSIYIANPTIRIPQNNLKSDGFRLEFQRDRDRILWSTYLKKLANKCQVFPFVGDDSLRRRLSHSIEVMQLATTISTSFGLDRDLTEAGAFVHDIGHTPFGHAGEFALDKLLNEIDKNFDGFNHYEHGVDVVCWLEDAYRSPASGSIPGLNLTYETIECLIKHTFFRENHNLGQTELIKRSKHKFLKDDSCHLEGQAIRIADKISYLISDIEDGIRMGAITTNNLMSCSFFLRPPIDIVPSKDETLYEKFLSQRRSILKVIMEDVLNATDKRLSKIKDLSEVRKTKEYIIDHSSDIKTELNEIWTKLQTDIIHKHPKVIESNMRAAKIISELFFLYALTPEIIDCNFIRNHNLLKNSDYINFYTNKVGLKVGIPKSSLIPFSIERNIGNKLHSQGANWQIDTYNIILAKDYIASLTDDKALSEYKKHINLTID